MKELKVKPPYTPEEARNEPSLCLAYECPKCRVGHTLIRFSLKSGKVECTRCKEIYQKPLEVSITSVLRRRKSPRFSNALPIEFWQIDNPQVRLGYTSNIGEGGLMASLSEQIGVGEKLRLKVFFISGRDLRTLDAIEVTAKVMWVNPDVKKIGHYRIGMEFEDITTKDANSLRNFLSHFGDR